MKIISIVGARPNFVKVAPLHRTFLSHWDMESKLVHTGQHYDARLSDVFFDQLNLSTPDYHLGIGSGTPAEQSAEIAFKFEKVITLEQPDWVLVVGDVTSTLACASVAFRMGVHVAHVEAGLRSGDHQMPEEHNRIKTDKLSDLLFVTEQAGIDNLRRESVADEKIHFVGNVMIDSLVRYRQKANELNASGNLGLRARNYVLMTMHRPANVDNEAGLRRVLQLVKETAVRQPVVLPVHPRTRASLTRFGLMRQLAATPNVRLLEPQGYLEFLNLMEHASLVITDSGGIQEETTYMQVPCLTFRDSTERPVTIELGTNQLLADLNPETVRRKVTDILEGRTKPGIIPPLWDGKAANRIAEIIYATQMNRSFTR